MVSWQGIPRATKERCRCKGHSMIKETFVECMVLALGVGVAVHVLVLSHPTCEKTRKYRRNTLFGKTYDEQSFLGTVTILIHEC
eukprot:5421602-Amphidinium_carterae.1